MSKKFTKVHVFDIDWDLEDEDSPSGCVSQQSAGLPSEFTIEVDPSYPIAPQIDKVFDCQFIWCVNGYSYEVLDDTGHQERSLSNPDKILMWLYSKPNSKGCLFAGDRITMTAELFNGNSKTFSNALYQLSKKGYAVKIDDAWYVTHDGEAYYYSNLEDDDEDSQDCIDDDTVEDDNDDESTSSEVNDYVKSAFEHAAEAFKYAAEAFKALA